jgi:hypothetical protein
MKVRIQFDVGPRVRKSGAKNCRLASAISTLLWPAILMAYSLAFWALAAQVKVAGDFAISSGIFSHWQVWAVSALALHLSALSLGRYGRTGDVRASMGLVSWLTNLGNRRA